MMKRLSTIVLGLALLALPANANAQLYNGVPDAQEYLNFVGGSGVGAYGVQVGPYSGSFQSDPTSVFSIYCVDFNHYAKSQDVNVTSLASASGDLSNTRADSYVQYQRAAYLASLFDSYTTNKWGAIHAQIWYEMSGAVLGTAAARQEFADLADANAASYDASAWYVLSPTNPGDSRSGQEFLMRTASVPEPTTFLLLASGLLMLAAFSRRKLASFD